jgi:hypothetical protein
MENLARRIKRELRKPGKQAHCAVYEDELQRIWPVTDKDRQSKIARFAMEHGFQLGFYKQGLCAIFQKAPPRKRPRKVGPVPRDPNGQKPGKAFLIQAFA